MEFEEVTGRLRKLSAYGDDLAGAVVDWHRHLNPDGSLGGWVQNQVFVEPGAIIEPEAIVFGKGVRLSSETSVRGASVVGPAVTTEGQADIDRSLVCGYSWDQDKQGLPRLVEGLGWPLDHTVIRDSSVSEAQVNASGLDHAAVFEGATVFGSGISRGLVSGTNTSVRGSLVSDGSQIIDGASATASILKEGAVLSGAQTSLERSTLAGGSQVKGGGRFMNCLVEKGALVERPGLQCNGEYIDSNRYSVGTAALPQALPPRLGAAAAAGRSFREELKHGPALVRARGDAGAERTAELPVQSFALAG